MKRKNKFILFSLISILSLSFLNFNKVEAAVDVIPNGQSAPAIKSDYQTSAYTRENFYANASIEGLKSTELKNALANLMNDKHDTYTTYNQLKGGSAYSDADPNRSGYIIDFYTQKSITNEWNASIYWNREHVWAKSLTNGTFGSKGESFGGADIHHLRPEIMNINSTRGNTPFGSTNQTGLKTYTSTAMNLNNVPWGWMSNNVFEPLDEVKGDVARILMYLYVHYSTEVSVNPSSSPHGLMKIEDIVSNGNADDPLDADACWDLLLKWNASDKVSEYEINRNEYCTSVTGTRNPFIDHPEFANMIWDNSYNGAGALLDTTLPGTGDNTGGDNTGEDNTGGDNTGGDNTGGDNTGGDNTGGDNENEGVLGTYELVTEASTLEAGDKLVLVQDDSNVVAGALEGSILSQVSTSFNNGMLETLPTGALEFELGGSAGSWTLSNNGKLLGSTSTKKLAWDSGTMNWTISINNGDATIQNNTSSYGRFLYNVNSPRFTTYTSSTSSSMLLPQLYKLVEGDTSDEPIENPIVDKLTNLVNKYYNSGNYTKKTNINLNEDAIEEINNYFHGKVQQDRTTYYKNDALLMGNEDGTLGDGTTGINSGYCTVTGLNIANVKADLPNSIVKEGYMAHYKYLNNDVVYDYVVSNLDGNTLTDGIKQFYVTLDKLVSENYFASWTDYTYSISDEKINDKYLQDFLAFVAPCLTDSIFSAKATSNYIDIPLMTLKVGEGKHDTYGNYLSLQIILDSTNSGFLTDDANLILAEARIYSGLNQFDETPEIVEPEPEVTEKTVFYDFSTFSGTSTQYNEETHNLGDITLKIDECHINSQLRIYSSSSNNGYAIISADGVIKSFTFNAGYKTDTLNVYGSVDGENWNLIQGVSVKTSYADYTVKIDENYGYKYLKLDVEGKEQIRIKTIGLTVLSEL